MRKILVYFCFLILSLLGGAYLAFCGDRIDFNMLNLAKIQSISPKQEQLARVANENFQKTLGKNVLLATTQKEFLAQVVQQSKESGLFESITYKFESLQAYKEQLQQLKIATLNEKQARLLLDNPKSFFLQRIEEFFMPFSVRPLPIEKDLLNISSLSNLLKNTSPVRPNFAEGLLEIRDKDKVYFFAKATLRDNYNPTKLLELIDSLDTQAKQLSTQEDFFLYSGGSIFLAHGKQQGEWEGSTLGALSLVCVCLVLLVAFRSLWILSISLVVFFGFMCGLVSVFIFFPSVSILSLILSTSLVGLVLDFALHWLGHVQKQTITISSINPMIKIFTIGLVVTGSGYLLFLFSPLSFLHQIAIFSIFTLLGAYFATIFLLPVILENKAFKSLSFFDNSLEIYKEGMIGVKTWYFHCNRWLKYYLIGVFLIILAVGSFLISKISFDDNITQYSSAKPELLQKSLKIITLTQSFNQSQFVLLPKQKEDLIAQEYNLTKDLLSKDIIATYWGLSSILLSKDLQEQVKKAFYEASSNKEILDLFKGLPISREVIREELINLSKIKTLDIPTFLSFELTKDFDMFVARENGDFVGNLFFVKNIKQKPLFLKTLSDNGAIFVDFREELSRTFTQAKENAIWLKVLGLSVAFVVLSLFFGFKKAFVMISIVLVATFFTLIAFVLSGLDINIFVIFGLILASAIGIDYVIFATNDRLDLGQKIFGITLASLTSFLSFVFLCLSSTHAVFSFGLATALCLLFCAILGNFLALNSYSKA